MTNNRTHENSTDTDRPAPGQSALPERCQLTSTAAGYLAELETAATLVQLRRDQVVLAEQLSWLSCPPPDRRARQGQGAAYNSPVLQVDGYARDRLQAELRAARLDVGRVAWWFATAALAALDAVLAGKDITARHLERLTLQRPGRDQEVGEATDPSAACYRPHLPGPGELRTGVDVLDAAMDQAMQPLAQAYAAASVAEDYYARMDDPDEQGADDDDEPTGLSDWQATELHNAEQQAIAIPGLLIEYARTVVTAAHRVTLP